MDFRNLIFIKALKSNDFKLSIVYSQAELDEVLKIVYNTYEKNGYILPNKDKIRFRENYEGSGKLSTIVAKDKCNKIAGTVGTIELSEKILLSHAYKKELEPLLKTNKVLEATNLVVIENKKETILFLELCRGIVYNLYKYNADYLFIEISKKHKIFFKNILKFTLFGDKRISNKDTNDETIGMLLNAKEVVYGDIYKDCPKQLEFFSKYKYIIE